MEKTIYICDLCGEEIRCYSVFHTRSFRSVSIEYLKGNSRESLDLCLKCRKEIKEKIEHLMKDKQEEK